MIVADLIGSTLAWFTAACIVFTVAVKLIDFHRFLNRFSRRLNRWLNESGTPDSVEVTLETLYARQDPTRPRFTESAVPEDVPYAATRNVRQQIERRRNG